MLERAQLTLVVRDLDRSCDFYGRHLGLPLDRRDGWAMIDIRGLRLALLERRDAEGPMERPEGTSRYMVGFEVRSLEEATARLREVGVPFEPRVVDAGAARYAFFTDPDGHPLHLVEVPG